MGSELYELYFILHQIIFVTIPHGGLRTEGAEKTMEIIGESPSHTVGSEPDNIMLGKFQGIGHHPTRWAQNKRLTIKILQALL